MEGPSPDFQNTTILVSAAQAGDKSALEDLFQRYLPVVRQIVAFRMGLRMRQLVDVDDVVQESLLRILQSIERFDHLTEGSFRHWLSRCVEREVIDSARRLEAKKRGAGKVHAMSSYESDMTMVSIPRQAGPTPSAILYGKELEERFEVALLELKDNQRELIILRQLCGMSFDEIAEATGSKEGTVRKTIARALEKLEQLMQV